MNVNVSDAQRNTRIATGLWLWFACGCLAVLLLPALRASDPTFGWLGYWCVLAPLIDLAIVYRARWPLAFGALLVRARRQRPRRQAARSRSYRRPRTRQHALLAAIVNP